MKTIHTAKRKPVKCPKCQSTKVATVLYGMAAYSPELEKKLDEGKIVLGGCIEGKAAWQCVNCGVEIVKEMPSVSSFRK